MWDGVGTNTTQGNARNLVNLDMKRRDFIKTSFAAATVAGLPQALTAAGNPGAAGRQQYYELRTYRFKSGQNPDRVDAYLRDAAIPAFNRLRIGPVGVFTELNEVEIPSRYVLIPYNSIDAFATAADHLHRDQAYLKTAEDYLNTPKANPAYDRIDSWLMLAFANMPTLVLPEYSREKKDRIFELRTYESRDEANALKKIEMFNTGEIGIMQRAGMAPVFYGQKIVGPNIPNLTYMLSGENMEAHKKHWSAFGSDPEWKRISKLPEYVDTVSHITNLFLKPMPYSEI